MSTLLLALALLLPQGAGGHGDGSERDAGWRADIEYVVSEARRSHADPGRPAWSPAFEEAADALSREVSELEDDEVLTRLMQLVALLDDGHTALYGPGPDSPLELEDRSLPLRFYHFPSGLFVLDGAEEWVDLAGSRVLAFGELDAEDVLARMSRYRGVDNEMTWTWLGPQFYLRRLLLLRAVGVEDEDGVVPIRIVDLEGEERTVLVPAGRVELRRKLRPFPLGLDEPPLYLSRVDTNYWLTPLPEVGAVYFQFNQVRDATPASIAIFAEELRAALKDSGARDLIVDVRHNNGGNNTLLRPLVRALIEFDMSAPENRIHVLMGRNTFSACQNFLNRVERWTDAVFVGEPSSSCPNFVGEDNEIVLPFSRVRGSISDRYWQDSDPWDDRPWIEPDLAVELTALDWVEGKDPVLEAVLAQLR